MKTCIHALRIAGVILCVGVIYLVLCAPGFLSAQSSTVPVSAEGSP